MRRTDGLNCINFWSNFANNFRLGLAFSRGISYNGNCFRDVAQVVERYFREVEVACSNHVIPMFRRNVTRSSCDVLRVTLPETGPRPVSIFFYRHYSKKNIKNQEKCIMLTVFFFFSFFFVWLPQLGELLFFCN